LTQTLSLTINFVNHKLTKRSAFGIIFSRFFIIFLILTREIVRGGKLIANTKAKIRELNSTAIIAAAEEVFALKGFKGATTQEIADLAGLPKANVHYYFKTKKNYMKC
jgi:hypothetical protein